MESAAVGLNSKKGVSMPRGDRTGPEGMGSMTGRRSGYCTGSNQPGFMNNIRRIGRGFSGYFRNGAGRSGAGYYNRNTNAQAYESPQLEQEIRDLKEQLNKIEARLSELTNG